MSDTDRDWTDLIVTERMQVDQEFSEKVAASNFSRQQWGLIMTAVEFDVEQPTDSERARLVADTRKVDAILPELNNLDNQGGVAEGGAGRGAGGPSGGSRGGRSGGLLGGIKDALGFDSGESDREQLAAAEELAQMYADDLQRELERRGKWERVRTAASESDE